jgi:hypothetical protein
MISERLLEGGRKRRESLRGEGGGERDSAREREGEGVPL